MPTGTCLQNALHRGDRPRGQACFSKKRGGLPSSLLLHLITEGAEQHRLFFCCCFYWPISFQLCDCGTKWQLLTQQATSWHSSDGYISATTGLALSLPFVNQSVTNFPLRKTTRWYPGCAFPFTVFCPTAARSWILNAYCDLVLELHWGPNATTERVVHSKYNGIFTVKSTYSESWGLRMNPVGILPKYHYPFLPQGLHLPSRALCKPYRTGLSTGPKGASYCLA